jgi:hypothetical protein
MPDEFLVFRSFYTEEEAISLTQFFKEKGIACSMVKHRPILDKVYVGVNYDPEFHVKINGYEFSKANEMLDRHIDQHLSEIGEDYYLYSFTDSELLEIIERPDEWNNQDIVISKKILRDRGVAITDKEVTERKVSRIKILEKPEREKAVFIFLGYFFSLFAFFGIGFALLVLNLKKTLPDGRKVFVYDSRTRGHGKNMLIIASITTALFFLKIFSHLAAPFLFVG